MKRTLALVATLAVFAFAQPPAQAAPGGTGRGAEDSSRVVPISAKQAERIAARDPKVVKRREQALEARTQRNPDSWQVGFFEGDSERVQVLVDVRTGRIRESWDGDQVAWRMARGYPGAFGRSVNAPWVWLPLCALFFLAFFDRRRPFRIAHLDLLMLLGFGVSHFFFNRGEIGVSVPLAYPFLLYALARMLWIGIRGRPADALRPAFPVVWLAVATIAILGLRVGLNLADSNVIDVGYAGVIGADRIADGDAVYGGFPAENPSGDTYGPVAYWAYVPFEQALPWSGKWDDLPAAHAAATFFDLATALLLFLAGRRLRAGPDGTSLGVSLAFAWAAFPYTAYVLESNANDSLVALLITAALLAASYPALRGAMAAAATLTKFAPAVLVPLLVAPYNRRGLIRFAAGLAATAALFLAWPVIDPGLSTFWDRTIGFQGGRDSPFSIWTQGGVPDAALTLVRAAVGAAAVALVATNPRLPLSRVAALGAAAVIGVELTLTHWFYLYIVWFLPLLLIALAWSGRGDLVEDLGDRSGEAVPADLHDGAHDPDVARGGLEAHRA